VLLLLLLFVVSQDTHHTKAQAMLHPVAVCLKHADCAAAAAAVCVVSGYTPHQSTGGLVPSYFMPEAR